MVTTDNIDRSLISLMEFRAELAHDQMSAEEIDRDDILKQAGEIANELDVDQNLVIATYRTVFQLAEVDETD
jgi:chorismate mutase